MQTLRVYRPRILIHGDVGMGQNYISAAALHHLEGYHIQTLELGTLVAHDLIVSYGTYPGIRVHRSPCESSHFRVLYR